MRKKNFMEALLEQAPPQPAAVEEEAGPEGLQIPPDLPEELPETEEVKAKRERIKRILAELQMPMASERETTV